MPEREATTRAARIGTDAGGRAAQVDQTVLAGVGDATQRQPSDVFALQPDVNIAHAQVAVSVTGVGVVRVGARSTLFLSLRHTRRTGLITPIDQDAVTSRPLRADLGVAHKAKAARR